MIQRIQSLYLLLTIIFSSIFLKGDFLKFINNNGSEIEMDLRGAWQVAGTGEPVHLPGYIFLSAIIVLIPVISFAALLSFKNRKLQIRITRVLIVSAVVYSGLLAYYAILLVRNYQAQFLPGFKTVIPLLVLVFAILAYRGIRKDENIVKSYDRLR